MYKTLIPVAKITLFIHSTKKYWTFLIEKSIKSTKNGITIMFF